MLLVVPTPSVRLRAVPMVAVLSPESVREVSGAAPTMVPLFSCRLVPAKPKLASEKIPIIPALITVPPR